MLRLFGTNLQSHQSKFLNENDLRKEQFHEWWILEKKKDRGSNFQSDSPLRNHEEEKKSKKKCHSQKLNLRNVFLGSDKSWSLSRRLIRCRICWWLGSEGEVEKWENRFQSQLCFEIYLSLFMISSTSMEWSFWKCEKRLKSREKLIKKIKAYSIALSLHKSTQKM